MATVRRHKGDTANFEELETMGQVLSMNGTVQTVVRMTVAHGRRVGLERAKAATIQRFEKAIVQVRRLR
jgi:ABC-type Fe2+-enterobactin transport system substrate-binding protein